MNPRMRPVAWWLCLSILLISAPVAAAQEQAALDQAVERHFGDRASAGAIVAVLLTPEGEFSRVAGATGSRGGTPPDRTTAFEAGSVTKLFTGMLLASLEEEGVIAADTRVGELVPPEHPLATAVADITLRELASHTSGLPRLATGGPAPLRALLRPGDPYRGSTAAEIFEALTLLGDEDVVGRGEFLYSNLGMALLGRLLEQAAGRSYETMVAEQLLLTLGMANSSFDCSDHAGTVRARGHRANLRPTGNWCLDGYAPAGGLVTTADDLTRLVRRGLAGNVPAVELSLEPLHRRNSTDAVGYAWMLRERDGRTLAWHNGRTGGYYAFVGLDRERQRGVVVLASVSFSGDLLGFDLLQGAVSPPAETDFGIWQAMLSLLLLLAPVLALGRLNALRRAAADRGAPARCRLHFIDTVVDVVLILAIAYWVLPWLVVPFVLWWVSLLASTTLLVAALPATSRLHWGLQARPLSTAGLVLWIAVAVTMILWVLRW